MKINSILNRYSDPAASGKRSEAAASESVTALEGFEPVIAAGGDAKALALREILSKYDVTDITPREFSEMLQQLHKEGLISDDLFGQLSLIRGELDRAGIDADESIDLVSFHEQQLGEISLDNMFTLGRDDETAVSADAKKNVEERLAWLRKIAEAQESPNSLGISAVA